MRTPGYFFLLLFFSLPVEAEIYRCLGDQGEPSFRQQPCGNDTLLAAPRSRTDAARVQGIRPSERAWLQQRERGQRRAAQTRKSARSSAAARDKAKRAQAYKCRSKKRALDGVRARLRRGYRPAAGEKLRRRREAYEDYLATFCS